MSADDSWNLEVVQAALSLSGPAGAMLLSMCETQFEQLVTHVPGNGGLAALLQACRELDEVAALLGPLRPNRTFEDAGRAYADSCRRDRIAEGRSPVAWAMGEELARIALYPRPL